MTPFNALALTVPKICAFKVKQIRPSLIGEFPTYEISKSEENISDF